MDGCKRLTEMVSAEGQQQSGGLARRRAQKITQREKNKCSLNRTALKIRRIAALVIAVHLYKIITKRCCIN